MQLLLFSLLFICAFSKSADYLNSFTADVDIYDMGRMGRGKNAGSWHRSMKLKQEVFYYLAMQPWRHLVWTDCTGDQCYKMFINEDASYLPKEDGSEKLTIDASQDYCRKEYAHPMATYDIDWSKIQSDTVLDAVDINGFTCYKYPAQIPLAYIYLREQYFQEGEVNGATVCRFDYIGGKSITFRSFGSVSEQFITGDMPTGYLVNKTRCNIDPSPNNVETDLAIVLGITDSNVVQLINGALSKLNGLTKLKEKKVYYLNKESIKTETITDWSALKTKQITGGSVDAVINYAKNDLVKRINSKAIKRGTMVVLMDRRLASTFNAETAFDRNDITVHVVAYNPKGDNSIRQRAASLLSIGEHYHEFTTPGGVSTVVDELYKGIRVNLTERCGLDTKCDGFCDGRDRCTCPMCCENTCYFSYCDATTATCKPWPPANPKPKIKCKDDCAGKQECRDLEGCVYTEYNNDCAPPSKCWKAYCDEDDNECKLRSTCASDSKPSLNNRCWNYTCNSQTGNCQRDKSGAECPRTNDLCKEYYCEADLTCQLRDKKCVKTQPYIEMKCYKARCNPKTGMCENALNCNGDLDTYTGCGKTAEQSLCKCDAESGFTCSCSGDKTGFCSEKEICDATVEGKDPYCRESACKQDLFIDGCQIKTCDEDTGYIEWKDYPCNEKVEFEYNGTRAKELCGDFFEIVCDKDETTGKAVCSARHKDNAQIKKVTVGCGECEFTGPVKIDDGKKDKYTITYTKADSKYQCTDYIATCPDGKIINATYFVNSLYAECEDEGDNAGECVWNELNSTVDAAEMCRETCFSGLICNEAEGYYEFQYDENTHTCSYTELKQAPQCYECIENKKYSPTCVDKKVEKEFEFKEGNGVVKFEYKIPKICVNDQCIPDYDFKCDNKEDSEIAAIYAALEKCSYKKEVNHKYHYSEKFDLGRLAQGRPQITEFIEEMEDQAYCTWTVKSGNCSYCGVENDVIVSVDRCIAEKAEEYGDYSIHVTHECNEETDTCVFKSGECEPEGCYKRLPGSYFNSAEKCVRYGDWTCDEKIADKDRRLAQYTKPEDQEELECHTAIHCDKEDQITCHFDMDSEKCKEAYRLYSEENHDYGCYIPNVECDYDTLHCTFRKMTHPSEDTKYFTQRDSVVSDNKCFNYTCEQKWIDGKLEHHWVLTPESIAEQTKPAASLCEVAACNPATGRSESTLIECLVSEAFPQISEQKAECFECKCSFVNGEMVLSMMPNTDTTTYELDACGNCIVRDRSGKQINEQIECKLEAVVNLTGAVAGATVAASVVFGLIGSMVVVSIGAFQTYQLVSSAMKNVISTTLENPEFVAADNEATNVLNNE